MRELTESRKQVLLRIVEDVELLDALDALCMLEQVRWEDSALAEAQKPEPNYPAVRDAAIQARTWGELIPIIKRRAKERDVH